MSGYSTAQIADLTRELTALRDVARRATEHCRLLRAMPYDDEAAQAACERMEGALSRAAELRPMDGA